MSTFHNYAFEANVSIVVDDGVGDVARVLYVDVVTYGRAEREGLIRYPESGLDCGIVTDFGIGSDADGVVESINDCAETYVGILGKSNIAVNGGIGSYLSR